jgi:hypothetical protein
MNGIHSEGGRLPLLCIARAVRKRKETFVVVDVDACSLGRAPIPQRQDAHGARPRPWDAED